MMSLTGNPDSCENRSRDGREDGAGPRKVDHRHRLVRARAQVGLGLCQQWRHFPFPVSPSDTKVSVQLIFHFWLKKYEATTDRFGVLDDQNFCSKFEQRHSTVFKTFLSLLDNFRHLLKRTQLNSKSFQRIVLFHFLDVLDKFRLATAENWFNLSPRCHFFVSVLFIF